MRIVRMVGGEVIRDRTIPSRFVTIGPGEFDITATRYLKRLERLLERRGDFVERARSRGQVARMCGDLHRRR